MRKDGEGTDRSAEAERRTSGRGWEGDEEYIHR